ncbi:unnamed protein product [Dracunculus medinensis]|uniref:KH_dom_type_1 domain-containing protein n=1 Tax=Dracunculus medinensis TaxID=318479 RepID=A0A158Q335_DRAME|nr:unnamed protein product [Dracunculus medinensis]
MHICRKALQILSEHEKAMKNLGPPLRVGNIDLDDRERNYVGSSKSELRIPISGQLDGGFIEVRAQKQLPADDFITSQVELELNKNNMKIIIYDDGDWI